MKATLCLDFRRIPCVSCRCCFAAFNVRPDSQLSHAAENLLCLHSQRGDVPALMPLPLFGFHRQWRCWPRDVTRARQCNRCFVLVHSSLWQKGGGLHLTRQRSLPSPPHLPPLLSAATITITIDKTVKQREAGHYILS